MIHQATLPPQRRHFRLQISHAKPVPMSPDEQHRVEQDLAPARILSGAAGNQSVRGWSSHPGGSSAFRVACSRPAMNANALMNRRELLASLAALGVVAIPTTATGQTRPLNILWRNAWAIVNIGDIGHVPGALALLRHYIPEATVTLWAQQDLVFRGTIAQRARFPEGSVDATTVSRKVIPDLKVVYGRLDEAGRADRSRARGGGRRRRHHGGRIGCRRERRRRPAPLSCADQEADRHLRRHHRLVQLHELRRRRRVDRRAGPARVPLRVHPRANIAASDGWRRRRWS